MNGMSRRWIRSMATVALTLMTASLVGAPVTAQTPVSPTSATATPARRAAIRTARSRSLSRRRPVRASTGGGTICPRRAQAQSTPMVVYWLHIRPLGSGTQSLCTTPAALPAWFRSCGRYRSRNARRGRVARSHRGRRRRSRSVHSRSTTSSTSCARGGTTRPPCVRPRLSRRFNSRCTSRRPSLWRSCPRSWSIFGDAAGGSYAAPPKSARSRSASRCARFHSA